MKALKSFFMFIGVVACGLMILFFMFNNQNGHGIGNNVKVINMNVFSEKLRDILRKSPGTLEELVKNINVKDGEELKARKNTIDVVISDETKTKNAANEQEKQNDAENAKPTDSDKKTPSLPMCSERGTNLGMEI